MSDVIEENKALSMFRYWLQDQVMKAECAGIRACDVLSKLLEALDVLDDLEHQTRPI